MSLDHLQEWVGKEEIAADHVSIRDAQRLAAVLGRSQGPGAGEELPTCWHWTLFQPLVPNDQLRPDGHPHSDEFLPPVPLPRRMFVGIDVEIERPLRLGETVVRRSVIDSIMPKQGRGGELVFVTLRHTLKSSGGGRIVEKHSFVFRAVADGKKPSPSSAEARRSEGPGERNQPVWRRTLVADPVLVFRFVATAFNAHRIHYDRDYAIGVEGYAERLVPGRLVALLLLEELYRRRSRPVSKFSFRAKQPLWVGQSMVLEGLSEVDGRADMWVTTESGAVAVEVAAKTRIIGSSDRPTDP
jgi:3-methylfumaryl-CoA hydratase